MQKPNLLIINNLIAPIENSLDQYVRFSTDLIKAESQNHIYGIFILSFSEFEYSTKLTLEYYLKHFPKKVPWEVKDKDDILNEELVLQPSYLKRMVDKYIVKTIRSGIAPYINKLTEILSISNISQDILAELSEKYATRNILVHNNLKSNLNYRKKSGSWARDDGSNQPLLIDKDYVESLIFLLTDITKQLKSNLEKKYKKYTKVYVQKELWKYLFQSPIMKFEDFWDINEQNDSVYRKKCDKEASLSSGEKLFLGLWQREFNGYSKLLNEGSTIGTLDLEHRKKLLYLISTLEELRLFANEPN